MKLDIRFINSKIGRRIFIIFSVSALFPILILATISYFQVSAQLEQQSYTRLKKEAKSHSLAIYERLGFIESELILFANYLSGKNDEFADQLPSSIGNNELKRFQVFFLLDDDFKSKNSKDKDFSFAKRFNENEINHVDKGGTLLKADVSQKGQTHILMIRRLPATSAPSQYLVGQINLSYLWGADTGTSVSAMTDIIVLDESNHLLFRSNSIQTVIPEQLHSQMSIASFGQFDLDFENERYLGAFRLIFMTPKFLTRGWQVVLRQPASYVLQPMSTFNKSFPIVVLISFLVVTLLSIFYIRKSLTPLDLLKNGMQSITSRNFEHHIVLNSGDEFQELAHRFNQMAGQLNHQFKTLNTKAEIDQSVLSSLEINTIIETAINGMQGLFNSDLLAINIINERNYHAQIYYFDRDVRQLNKSRIAFLEKDIKLLKQNAEYLVADPTICPDAIVDVFKGLHLHEYLLLPIILDDKISATIVLATKKNKLPYDDEEILQARQMADQVGVALANAGLVRELNLISWSTLRAFARAVDAKSPWTAGHSERVAKMAVKIGSRMRLDDKTLEHLRRAAFLHDIGKIGISSSILDKPGKLTSDEYDIIKTHPVLGTRILEPIPAFAPMLPMIQQHHEKYSGGGYPLGVSAKLIDRGARILAVADVFDALISDRPYRKGMPIDKALNIMRSESGKAFDPSILEIFYQILEYND